MSTTTMNIPSVTTTQSSTTTSGEQPPNIIVVVGGDVGRGSVDSNSCSSSGEEACVAITGIGEEVAICCMAQQQDNNNAGGNDSGRESVNEFDSSLDETRDVVLRQASKKHCADSEFYASRGSQTKWYLKPVDDAHVDVDADADDDDVDVVTTIGKQGTTFYGDIETNATNATNTTTNMKVKDNNVGDLSKSAIYVHPTTTTTTTTTTSTTNDGVSVVGIRNGYTTNLSQQMRAVSSPSLTEAVQHETTAVAAALRNLRSKENDDDDDEHNARKNNGIDTPAGASEMNTRTTTTTANSGNNSNNNNKNHHYNHNHTTSLTTSQSIGVLQKFKRTLTNFNNKNQLQITSNATPATAATTTSTTSTTTAAASTATATTSGTQQQLLTAATAAAASNDINVTAATTSTDVTDSTSGKYRFGPLIWRSSKERRKTKFNRRDKCNSGDSGIQIELENDEQFARAMSATGAVHGASDASNIAAAGCGNDADEHKLHAVRRTNSAKSSSITADQHPQTTSAALTAKARILRKMEMSNEREAPESLPTRSLSQPNGLESYGMGRADLDDSDSDSVASHEEATNYYPVYAEVLYSFTAAGPQELGLERGTLIEILRKEVGPWWFGRIKKEDASLVEEILDPELGWFPREFVRIIKCPETDTFFATQMSTTNKTATSGANSKNTTMLDTDATIVDQNNITTIIIESPSTFIGSESPTAMTKTSPVTSSSPLVPSARVNIIIDNADILRRSAIRELLDTEVNYVKLLASICEGYLPEMNKRIDIFSPNSIRLIFSNITAIYKFQRKFLEALRKGIEQNQIAKVFLKMHKGFLCYSTYCNAYPRALIELETYDRSRDARTILENCRESENLAELPLSAHLLAPVQRICRYPLHLAEIIKTAAVTAQIDNDCDNDAEQTNKSEAAQYEQLDVSQMDIPDTRHMVDLALEAMKSVTEAVNEGKRHSETIARHQASFQNFKGPPLHLHSTRFFLQIDATRQKQNLWNSSYTLFLFDNQLVYCKRDIIKRSHFIYKGRIFLDRCRVVNVRDGKMFGHTIKNSLRIYCEARDKWYDFSFRSANRKHRFLNTLALERQFGGKALYVSEMTGFEYHLNEERDYSDQSDYDMPESEQQQQHQTSSSTNGSSSNGGGLKLRDYSYEQAATSGESSSVPESPAKCYKYSDTLPKKSQSRETIANINETQSGGSLGRRRLGNWFRKPKSTTCTPSQSPTHKSNLLDADMTLTAAVAAELEAQAETSSA